MLPLSRKRFFPRYFHSWFLPLAVAMLIHVQLNIPDDDHTHQLIYRVVGESKGEQLSDADIMRHYQLHGDSASTLRFLVQQHKLRLPSDGRLLPPIPTTATAPYPPILDPTLRAVEGLPPLGRNRDEESYDASVSDDGDRAFRHKHLPPMPPPPQGPPPRPPVENSRRTVPRHTSVTPTPSQVPPQSKIYPPDYNFSVAAEPPYTQPPDNRYARNETAQPQPLYPSYPDDRDFHPQRPKPTQSLSYGDKPKAPTAQASVDEYTVYSTVSGGSHQRRRMDSPNQNGHTPTSALPHPTVRGVSRASNGPRSPHSTSQSKSKGQNGSQNILFKLRMPSKPMRVDNSYFMRSQFAQGDSPRNSGMTSGQLRHMQQQPPPAQATSPEGGRGLQTSRSADGGLRQQYAEHEQRNAGSAAPASGGCAGAGAGGGAPMQSGGGSPRYSPVATKRPQGVYGVNMNGYRVVDTASPSHGDGAYSPRSPTNLRRQDHINRSPRDPPMSLQPGRGSSTSSIRGADLYPSAVVPPINIPMTASNNNYNFSPPYASDIALYGHPYNPSPHLPPVQSSSLPRALERSSPMALGTIVRLPMQSSPRQPMQSLWPGEDGYPPPSPSPSTSSPVRGPRALPTPGGVTNSPQKRANVDLHRLTGDRDRDRDREREREQKPQEETRRHAIPEPAPFVPPRQESLTGVCVQYGRLIEKGGANGGASPTRRGIPPSPARSANGEEGFHTDDDEDSNDGTVRAEERNRLQAARKLEGLSDNETIGIAVGSSTSLAPGPASAISSNETTLIVGHTSKPVPPQDYQTDELATEVPSTYEGSANRGDPWNDDEEEGSQFDDEYGTMNSLWQTPLVKRFSMMVRGPRPAVLNIPLAATPGLETIPSSADTMTPRGLGNMNGAPGVFDFRDFRPAIEDVYNRLDKFFPDHDLDKPVVESAGTSGGNSPTVTEQPPPMSYIAPLPSDAKQVDRVLIDDERGHGLDKGVAHLRRRSGHKKSMRYVAGERRKAMDRTSKLGLDDAASTVARKRSTKFWGNKMKEITPDEYQKFGNGSAGPARVGGAPDSPIRAPDSPSAVPAASIKDGFSTGVIPWVRGKLIGKGTYGRVYLAFNFNTGEVFAVKRVEMPESASDHTDPKQKLVLEAIKAESKTLQDLDHPHIVQYLGFEQTAKYYSM
jgi:hypothetical protein